MARYINSYSTAADVQSAIDGGTLNKPYVAYIENDDVIDWNSKSVDYSKMPLTFEIISGGTISWQGPTITPIEKNINNTGWSTVEMNDGNTAFTFNVNAGDVVQFRGNNNVYGANNSNYGFKGSTSIFNVYGNIMSLINSTGYTTAVTLVGYYVFGYLFSNCTGLTDASNLVLPATFLKENSYAYMFQNCSSLTTAPILPATNLYMYCYRSMFENCSNLNYIKCLATNISALNCTKNWVSGVASTGTFVTPASTNWTTGTSGIPSGWTRVDA